MNEMLIIILKTITDVYSGMLVIRLLLQLVQADFYNPVSQGIVRICSPLVNPIGKVLPTLGRLNTAALLAAILVKWSFYVAVTAFSGILSVEVLAFLALAIFELLRLLIEIYFWGILILVIFSWVGTPSHPAALLVNQIISPYMRPFRKYIPSIGMIDISPMVAIFTLMIIRAQLLPAFAGLIRPLFS